jgi:hypothetical protein
MTVVPLPASPCVRVKLDYLNTDSSEASSRFYLSYSGSAPTGADCIALATAVALSWHDNLAGAVAPDYSLVEVDVLDIATDTGLSGQWTGSDPGLNTGTALPAQSAMNVEFGIARRYRGGKPRMFLPPGITGNQADAGHWNSTFVGVVTSAVEVFFSSIGSDTIGAMGTLAHVNLSYYKGFTNVTNSSGRTRAAPKYQYPAAVDPITGYSAKALIGSQRRRRNATTY